METKTLDEQLTELETERSELEQGAILRQKEAKEKKIYNNAWTLLVVLKTKRYAIAGQGTILYSYPRNYKFLVVRGEPCFDDNVRIYYDSRLVFKSSLREPAECYKPGAWENVLDEELKKLDTKYGLEREIYQLKANFGF